MPVFLMFVPVAAFAMAAACPQPPSTKVRVAGHVDELTIGTAFDLAELRALSDRFGRRRKHAPVGFYRTGISAAVTVGIGNDRQDLCTGPIKIEVTISLTERHIEIGRDLLNDPCRFSAAVAHYQHHAEADAASFRHYVVVATQTLTRAALTDLISAGGDTGSRGITIAPAILSIIRPVLDDMRAAQPAAIEAVDTQAEIGLLENTCNGPHYCPEFSERTA